LIFFCQFEINLWKNRVAGSAFAVDPPDFAIRMSAAADHGPHLFFLLLHQPVEFAYNLRICAAGRSGGESGN
jgi:hypothetical protein